MTGTCAKQSLMQMQQDELSHAQLTLRWSAPSETGPSIDIITAFTLPTHPPSRAHVERRRGRRWSQSSNPAPASITMSTKHFHAPRFQHATPRALLACMALVFVLSLISQLVWVSRTGSSCTSAWCRSKLLQSLRIVPRRNSKMMKLEDEDPEACVPISSHHVESRWAPKDACWKRRDIQRMLVDLVSNFSATMNAYNVSHWVDSGTLLGAVRHQGIIPYDQDSDFGVDEDAYEFLRDNHIDVPAPYVLHVWNSSVNDRGNRDEPLPIRLINSDSGLYSDVFVFKRGVDRFGRPLLGPIPSGCFGSCAKCVIVDGEGHFEVPRDWIYPLATCKFAHFNVTCPRESIKYVEYMFGDDYMTPQ